MKKRSLIAVIVIAVIMLFGIFGRGYWYPFYVMLVGKRTVDDVIHEYGNEARLRMKPAFDRLGISYPPEKVTLLAMKDSRMLELWVFDGTSWQQVSIYNISATSGKPGPKLLEGDRQVPEGIYHIEGLNPNSLYHLSMKLNYPNEFDRKWAEIENRHRPGSNIFIHGKAVSIGCLAMGDRVIEELFVLVNDAGLPNVEVIIAPTDPRLNKLAPPQGAQPWVEDLYDMIEAGFEPYRHQ